MTYLGFGMKLVYGMKLPSGLAMIEYSQQCIMIYIIVYHSQIHGISQRIILITTVDEDHFCFL